MSKALSEEENQAIIALLDDVARSVVGRGWVDRVSELSTRGIAFLLSEMRSGSTMPEKLEVTQAARSAAEIIVHDRLTRDQIGASERLAEASHEVTTALQESGRVTAWRIALVSSLVGAVTGSIFTLIVTRVLA